ncbi:hypothetical protein [Dyella tabacisoli]|uniref:DUF2063 domain-containing protein n=1 Tax=Dyella tabacisoli TaxID=2282381 RepID=A0A369UNQ8_9GAMM|nr:hypothetical protein [Dyella tabacisoli]RDD82171.1 hypothetical protein DVJ77_07005 [Dyella tabacisoli]
MNLHRLHAVLAAGVEQPQLLEQWDRQPGLLSQLGVDPSGLDLAALRKFAGLTVKVRHNPLREQMPLSFRLMSIASIEIDMFADYAMFRSKRQLRYATSAAARAGDLLDFLADWIDPAKREQLLLWDVIRYEDAIARLGPWLEQTPEAVDNSVTACPRLRGTVLLHELQSDPRALADMLYTSAPDLSRVPLQPQHLCFWRAPESDQAAVLTLDELGFYLLSMLDGQRSVSALTQCLGGGRDARNAVSRGLRAFSKLGIVILPDRIRRH